MKIPCLIPVVSVAVLVGACSKEPPPAHSVLEFTENSILLEATMVRCAQNRTEKKYDADCLNAREAVNRIAARQEEERRKELEAQSERKRRALRRTQEAAAEARRRATEEQRRREEAEYLGIYEAIPGDGVDPTTTTQPDASAVEPRPQQVLQDNEPGAIIDETDSGDETGTISSESPDDIDAVREELKRRQDGGN